MNALEDLIHRLKTIPYEQIGLEAMRETKSVAVDLNLAQLQNGLLADGTVISPDYFNPEYASLKASMNPLAGFGTPDLNFTGAFYSHIEAEDTATGIQLFSLDIKTGALVLKYGPNIIGLSVASRREYLNYVQPLLVLGIKKHFDQ